MDILIKHKYAKRVLALCQLMTLAHVMNKEWKPTWPDHSLKYFIRFNYVEKKLVVDYTLSTDLSLIYFETREQADFSLKNHHQLWSDYWMI